MTPSDISTLIVAFSGATATLYGVNLSLAARKETKREEEAASRFKENRSQRDDLRESLEVCRADRDQYRRERDELRAESRAHLEEQRGYCAQNTAALTDALSTLRQVVLDETYRASADRSLEDAREHLREHDTGS